MLYMYVVVNVCRLITHMCFVLQAIYTNTYTACVVCYGLQIISNLLV